MNTSQRGFSLLEALAALAIGAMMMIGVASLMDTPLEETQGQQAALHQLQVTNAAAQYITDNYLALVASATATQPTPVTVAMLRAGGYLSSNFADTNSFGQTPCVLVMEPTANKLDALIATEGGTAIPSRLLPYVAANAGQGGGFIESSGGSLVGRGAFGSASVATATLTNYLSRNCTGTAATAGHLANNLFYGGPGRLTTDFLYRDQVPGNPELNRMTTPLQIRLATEAVENSTTDPLCSAADNTTWGRFVVNTNGVILSCQAGTWKRPPNLYWRDPVSTHAALPLTDNNVGDVRMVTGLQRAFTWNVNAGVGSWVALAVDENGVLKTDYVQINQAVTKGTACTTTGLVARDTDGLILSCQNGYWETQATTELGSSETTCQRIRPSKFSIPADEASCPTIFPQGSITYNSSYDTYYATVSRSVTLTKNGLISVGAWSLFSRGLVSDPGNANGQAELVITIKNSSGTVLASSIAKTPYLTNTATGINVPLSKAVAKGSYTIEVITAYSLFDGGSTTFNESNFTLYNGSTLQETPLMTGWTIDVYY